VVKKLPEGKTSKADDDKTDPAPAAAADPASDRTNDAALLKTEHQATSSGPVSDVVLAEDDASKQVSDVVLAEDDASKQVSDVILAESLTIRAPSFRAPSPPVAPVPAMLGPDAPTEAPNTIELKPDARRAPRDDMPMALLPGAKVDDFEIVRLLGRGAFGHVYLARQMSLDRLVALKISANRGSEGRTMARLEHQHIVQVFSEKVDADFNQRLLCMQLVPGIGLDKLIGMLHSKAGSGEQGAGSKAKSGSCNWTGAELLGFIDGSGPLPTALDPSALHDREALGRMDAIEATAWFGARLAEALDFAHKHGVLHRDIKPANILVNPYGRPMLADFNISSQPVGSESSGEEMFGGTFAYMAPEHLDAFNPSDTTGHEAVTARSDMYSLGLVLQQLLDGRMSYPLFSRRAKMADTLRAMSDERKQRAPICKAGQPGARMTLERSIGRCLEPNPLARFASGAELAEQLGGCRRLREAEQRLPGFPAMYAPLLSRPFLWIVLLVVLPQIGASIINIAYNTTQIVHELKEDQKEQFKHLVAGYNVIVYPLAILAFVLAIRPVWRCWNALSRAERLPDGKVKAARQKALRLPRFIAVLTAVGWFPGGIIFPLAIQVTSGLDFNIAAHFVASFCLSGLIALAYSLCGVEFVVLRGLYPGLWRDAQNFTAVAREELAPVKAQLNRIEILAVLIPLFAAIFMLFLSGASNRTFKFLVASLIILGIMGFHITSKITRNLYEVVVALTNTKA
jgi:serine/threonine protein kinase